MQRGEGDEVVLVVRVEVEERMADLLRPVSFSAIKPDILACLDVDGRLEGGLLRVVALQTHAVLAVPNAVSRDRRMMTDHVALAIRCTCLSISLRT